MFFSDSTTTTVIDRTVEPCALFLRAESAETETGGPISGEVCSVSVALGAVGLSVCVEVPQPNVFLFQRDFFTVCFSPTLCVRARKAFYAFWWGGREQELGCIPTSQKPRVQDSAFFCCFFFFLRLT